MMVASPRCLCWCGRIAGVAHWKFASGPWYVTESWPPGRIYRTFPNYQLACECHAKHICRWVVFAWLRWRDARGHIIIKDSPAEGTVRRKVAGTTGLGCPVEMSQRSVVSVGPNRTSWRTGPDVAVWYVAISLSFRWAAAMAVKSTPGSKLSITLMMARDSATAMRLLFPAMCLILVVYSDIAARWRCCRDDQGIPWWKQMWVACGLWKLCRPIPRGNNGSVTLSGKGSGAHDLMHCIFVQGVWVAGWRKLVAATSHWRAARVQRPLLLLKHRQWWL